MNANGNGSASDGAGGDPTASDGGGWGDGDLGAAASGDLSQSRLLHGSWWPSQDAIWICGCAASQRHAAADTADRGWSADGAAAAGAGHQWCPPDAPDPRSCAGSCSCPCP